MRTVISAAVVGALLAIASPAPSLASPSFGGSALAAVTQSDRSTQQVHYRYYRPYYYGPRYYRPYYRPYYYRPYYYGPRYYYGPSYYYGPRYYRPWYW